MPDYAQIERDFLTEQRSLNAYDQALSLLGWDARTGAPKKGVEERSEVVGALATELFARKTSGRLKEMSQYLLEPEAASQVSAVARRAAEETLTEVERMEHLPQEEYQAFTTLTSKTESYWEDAKASGDFDGFRPYLEEIVAYQRRFADYLGYDGHPYDALLHDFEPGMTVSTLHATFSRLRDGLLPLVEQVKAASVGPDTSFLHAHFPKDRQRAFSEHVLRQMTYDFDAGRLDETVHPFAVGLNRNDVRVTTKYDESDFRTAVFGTIHEGGHALYEQNLGAGLAGTILADGASMGIHESQSLFWENFVARTRSFWENNYDKLQELSGGQFQHVALDDFYFAVNSVEPSLIRIEADEMTYSLHIILRYELEKSLIEGSLQVKDLPEAWNEKMKQYLGVAPSNHAEGVLQDVHWAGGAFGYFPSYALGYIYAAQLQQAMVRDLPAFDDLIASGDLAPVRHWLTEHVHQHGRMKRPADIIEAATGEGTNPEPLLAHLSHKYQSLYRWS